MGSQPTKQLSQRTYLLAQASSLTLDFCGSESIVCVVIGCWSWLLAGRKMVVKKNIAVKLKIRGNYSEKELRKLSAETYTPHNWREWLWMPAGGSAFWVPSDLCFYLFLRLPKIYVSCLLSLCLTGSAHFFYSEKTSSCMLRTNPSLLPNHWGCNQCSKHWRYHFHLSGELFWKCNHHRYRQTNLSGSCRHRRRGHLNARWKHHIVTNVS